MRGWGAGGGVRTISASVIASGNYCVHVRGTRWAGEAYLIHPSHACSYIWLTFCACTIGIPVRRCDIHCCGIGTAGLNTKQSRHAVQQWYTFVVLQHLCCKVHYCQQLSAKAETSQESMFFECCCLLEGINHAMCCIRWMQ